MYTQKPVCDYCQDPAIHVRKIKQHFWPFKTIEVRAYCKECYLELVKKKIPRVTDPKYQSRKGKGRRMRNRRNLMD